MSDRALRVLQLYPKADYFTGAAIQLRELARGLAARGHAVTVATPPGPHGARLAAPGVEHVALPLRRAWDLRAAWQLRRLVRARRIDVIHAHKGRARTLAILAGLLGPRPPLVLNRGVSFVPGRLNRLGYTTRRVDAIVAVCRSIKDDLVRIGVPADKIEVIYSGTDVRRFHPGVDGAPLRAELGFAPAHFVITQIGVRSWRGWSDVLAAMRRVAEAVPAARLLFVGAPPPAVARLSDRARELGIGHRVLVIGPREDVPVVMAASDAVVDASWGGLGITGSIREALACERPVVATRLAGMPELVVDGETGLLVPPRDPDALAAALLRLHADATWRQQLARAGRKRVEAEFSLDAKVEATERLYRRLAGA